MSITTRSKNYNTIYQYRQVPLPTSKTYNERGEGSAFAIVEVTMKRFLRKCWDKGRRSSIDRQRGREPVSEVETTSFREVFPPNLDAWAKNRNALLEKLKARSPKPFRCTVR